MKNTFNVARLGSLVVSLLLLISANCYSQNVISRDVANTALYPSNTTYSGGIVTYPVQYYDVEIEYTIPLQGGVYTTATVNFDTIYAIYPCSVLRNNTTFSFDKDLGKIIITPRFHCSSADVLEFRIVANYNNGTEYDYQIFRIPFDRLPVKTVLVMDISGSMGAYTNSGETRWSVLKKAVDIFTISYEFFRQDDKDSIGLTYFTTNIIQPNPPIEDGFIGITAWDADPSSADTIRKDMNARGPMNTTAMGKGLYNARTKLKSDAINKSRKIAVLFTDGLQNVQPFVSVADGNSLTDGTTLNDPGDKIDSIRYFTIASWLPGDTPPVLVKIAEVSDGETMHKTSTSVTDTEVEDYFMANLETILHGESPQIVGTAVGKVTNNQVVHTINLNGNISKAAFILSYGTGDAIEVTVEKDGIELPVSRSIGKNFMFIGLEFEPGDAVNSSGQYKIKVSGNTNKPYKLTCIADDHYFNYDISLNKPIFTVGDTIEFTAEMSFAGLPLSNPGDTVKVALFKPGDDVGNLLSIYDAALTGDVIDQGTPAQQKFELLFSSDSTFRNALLPEEQKIVLDNLGNGKFKGKFTATELTGVYKMLVYVNAKTETNGIFEREKIITSIFEFGQVEPETPDIVDNTTVPPAPDSTATTQPGTTPDSTGTATPGTTTGQGKTDKFNPLVLQIRPRNKYGYFMGPGYESKVNVKIISWKPEKKRLKQSSFFSLAPPVGGEPYVRYIYDNLDGRYFIYIGDVGKRDNPKIEIMIGTEMLYTGKVFRIPVWFYILLAILLILLIIIRYFKLQNIRVYKILLWIFTLICLVILILHYLGYLRFLY